MPEQRRTPEQLTQSDETPIGERGTGFRATSVQKSQMLPPRVTTDTQAEKPFAGQNVTILTLRNTLQQALEEVRGEFEAATGATLEIVPVKFEHLYLQFVNDSTAVAPKFDGAIAAAWWIGDLASKDMIRSYDDFYGDPRFPPWEIEDVQESPRRLLSYQGKKYMVPYDHDAQVLYYRRDLFSDSTHKQAFAAKYGYPLMPPRTWRELRDMVEYFNGKDFNGDGEPDYGISLHLRAGSQSMFHFMSFSAPFLIGPENTSHYWFDPITMRPVINSPGHERALDRFVDLIKFGHTDMLEWDLAQAWDCFLQGRAALTFTWGDLGAFAQQEGSKVKGLTASTVLPGTTAYYHPIEKRWIETKEVNRVGNTIGGSWAGIISSRADAPEATYYLYSLLAHQEKAMIYAARGSDGVDPGRYSQLLPPHGQGRIEVYKAAGWHEADIRDYSRAFFENYDNKQQFPYLRIPGTFSYWLSLDAPLFRAASGQLTPKAALDAAILDFEELTDRIGRDKVKPVYRTSLGL